MGADTDYDTIQYTADWTIQGACTDATTQVECGR